MSRNRRGTILVLWVLVMSVVMLAGCRENSAGGKGPGGSVAQRKTAGEKGYWDLLEKVSDSSELPDWQGKQIKLTMWYAHGQGVPEKPRAEQDVVWPEIARITGVTIDGEKSYDNNGQDFKVKLGLLAAGKDWPDIVVLPDTKELVDAELVYDLTELLPKYAPNLLRRINKTYFDQLASNSAVHGGRPGNIYTFPSQIDPFILPEMDASIDMTRFSRIAPPQSPHVYGFIWVRDDILRKVYPEAMTLREIEDHYMQYGRFDEEEIFDVPIDSMEEFAAFLRKIKKVIEDEDIKEGNIPVRVTYATSGSGDNWGLLTCLNGRLQGSSVFTTYYTYFDKETGRIEYAFNQDWFKESLRLYSRLVDEDVMSKDSLVENAATFTQNLNNGLYAVTYAWQKPDAATLRSAGKPYEYRKVFPRIPIRTDKFLVPAGPAAPGYTVAIFKDSVDEEDLPQILRWLDFMVSEVGEKLIYWGPKTAGLWEEKEGGRVYTSSALEDNMVYGEANGEARKYGLYNSWTQVAKRPWPYYPVFAAGGSRLHPRYTYPDIKRNRSEVDTFFSEAQVAGWDLESMKVPLAKSTEFWHYVSDVEGIEKWNNARSVYEEALMKVLTAKNDEMFEKLYDEMVVAARRVGANDETLDEVNKVFKEANKDYQYLQ